MPLRPLNLAIRGVGAVSPAGWTAADLARAVSGGSDPAIPGEETRREPGAPLVRLRRVPKPATPLPFARESRLRRTSPIAQYGVSAALEALGGDRLAAIRAGALRVAVIGTIMNGCVNFSRRFYSEVLADPRTASPLIFPETVFNAPSSHLSALIGSTAANYTLVGDGAQFAAAFDLADQWLEAGEADGCLIVGAEELDWLSAEGAALLDRTLIVSEGAAAVYLERTEDGGAIQIEGPHPVTGKAARFRAAQAVSQSLTGGVTGSHTALFDGLSGSAGDRPERQAFATWAGPRQSPKTVLGDGLGAAAGWQIVAAHLWQTAHPESVAAVSCIGANQRAVGLLIG